MEQIVWSETRLQRYWTCPRAYYLAYEARPKPRVPTPHYFVFGKAIHEAVRICHKGPYNQRFQPSDDRKLYFKSAQAFGRFWFGLWRRMVAEAEANTGIRWRNPEEREKEIAVQSSIGWAVLAGTKDGKSIGYYNGVLGLDGVTILEVEFPFEVVLWGYHFTGKIDHIQRRGDQIVIVDFTTSWYSNIKQTQLAAYQLAVEQLRDTDPRYQERFSGEIVQCVWNLRTGKLESVPPEDPSIFHAMLDEASAGVQIEDFRALHTDYACGYCEYRDICPQTEAKPIPPIGNGPVVVDLPPPPPKPLGRQGHFSKGAKGGWIRGGQVKGQV